MVTNRQLLPRLEENAQVPVTSSIAATDKVNRAPPHATKDVLLACAMTDLLSKIHCVFPWLLDYCIGQSFTRCVTDDETWKDSSVTA